jgi:hypothetical protein
MVKYETGKDGEKGEEKLAREREREKKEKKEKKYKKQYNNKDKNNDKKEKKQRWLPKGNKGQMGDRPKSTAAQGNEKRERSRGLKEKCAPKLVAEALERRAQAQVRKHSAFAKAWVVEQHDLEFAELAERHNWLNDKPIAKSWYASFKAKGVKAVILPGHTHADSLRSHMRLVRKVRSMTT